MDAKLFKPPKWREEQWVIITGLNWIPTITQQFPPNDILMPHCLLSLFCSCWHCTLDVHPNRPITVSSCWCIEANVVLVWLTWLTLWWSEQEFAGGKEWSAGPETPAALYQSTVASIPAGATWPTPSVTVVISRHCQKQGLDLAAGVHQGSVMGH